MREVFLDTSYAIALSSEKDRFHDKALELADQLEADKSFLITTRPVLLEIGNALSGLRFRESGALLLDSLENDPNVGIVSLTDALYQQGVRFFRKRMDKEWGLVDCISFVVMLERKIYDALATFGRRGLGLCFWSNCLNREARDFRICRIAPQSRPSFNPGYSGSDHST